MEKNRIWLLIFAIVAAIGTYLWWTGSRTATLPPEPEQAESALSDTEAPALGTNDDSVRPVAPGGRQGGFSDPQSPAIESAPPPGFASPPPNLESFNPPPQNMEQPPQAFEPINPPSSIENPGFVSPPPPPQQFDTEPVPFQDPIPFDENGQTFDGAPPGDFAPPPPPEEDY